MTKTIVLATLLFATIAGAQPTPTPTPGTPTPGAPAPGTPAPGTPAPAPGTPAPGTPGTPATGAPMNDEQKKAEAKVLYEQGLGDYNLGKFNSAITAFTKAYELTSAPGLLFNIAQSHRLNKEYEKAGFFYTTYLRLKPEATNRADVEQRITEMEGLLAKQKEMEKAPPMGTVTPDGNSKSTSTTTTDADLKLKTGPSDTPGGIPAKTLQMAGIITAASGGAFLLTGIVFGAMANSAASDLQGVPVWTQAEQDKYDAGERNNTIAIVSFVVGGAAVATGGTLFVLGHLKKQKAANVAIVPTKGGTTVAVGWSF